MRSSRNQKLSDKFFLRARWLSAGLVFQLLVTWVLPLATLVSAAPKEFTPPQIGIQPAGLTITVNTTGDGNALDPNTGCDVDAGTPGEQCTLRSAIQRANAVAGEDTIDFNIPTSQPNCDAGTGKCTIKLTGALPNLSTDVVVDGPGAGKLSVRRDTGGDYSIFNITTTGSVTLADMKLESGRSPIGAGGGIFNFANADVNVIGVTLSANSAVFGGGIYVQGAGTLNVAGSVFDGNVATNGGAIYNAGGGNVNVSNSRFSGNAAGGDGGAIDNNLTGTFTITNSTFFENSAGNGGSALGGGVRNVAAGAMSISNCTFLENIAASAGGISGTATVKSTIVVKSFSANLLRQVSDVDGNITPAGFNLIGDKGATTGFTQPTDQTGTVAAPLDGKFDFFSIPAEFKTEFVIPRCGSPVVDPGSSDSLNGPLTTDQRGAGFPRTIDDPIRPNAAGGDGTDIGALERSPC